MGTSRTPGPIGTEARIADEVQQEGNFIPGAGYADPRPTGSATLDADALKGPVGGGSVEITIIGKFPYPWPSVKDEVLAMVKKVWEPSEKDFDDVAKKDTPDPKNIHAADNVNSFIAQILSRPDKSIVCLNVLTHSNAGLIAFGGTINSSTGVVMLDPSGGVADPANGSLDSDALVGLRKNLPQNLKKIRSKFVDETALMIFYACHSGLGPAADLFLQEIADTFQVVAKGFKQTIAYCPKYKDPPPPYNITDRTFTDIGSCSTNPTKHGFKHLTPEMSKVPNLKKFPLP